MKRLSLAGVALAIEASGSSRSCTRKIWSSASRRPLPSASTNTIQPSRQAALLAQATPPAELQTLTVRARLMASERA